MDHNARPGFDPELRAGLAVVGGMFPPTITPELIPFMRESYASAPIDRLLSERGIVRTDEVIEGYDGGPITVSVLRAASSIGARPVVVYAHSGGLMFGDRFSGIDLVLDWVDRLDVVLVTVEYRLAPEHPDPYPREDMYAALIWASENAERLGARADRLLLAGASAGGGIVAGLALAARDRGGPQACGMVLDYPMLDDRGRTDSTGQFDGIGVWDRVSNETGWAALLGAERGGPQVSPYAAPSRATDLAGLPPALIIVGAAEIFRDEAIAFANGIWAAGGEADLHVFAGAFHACDIFAPHTGVGREMIRVRNTWVSRILGD